jgi:hypothetical protein
VPRAFSRRIEGFLPLVRLGWAVVRPQSPNASNAPGQ